MWRQHSNKGRHVLCAIATLVALLSIPAALAQLAPEVARYGYPEVIFFNGKVVSMDDASTSTDVGHVYQAIAVKGDKIVKLGANDAVKALAGPDISRRARSAPSRGISRGTSWRTP